MVDTLTHKERTRARILDEAAKALREHGTEGIGVASLMKRAGLTHGGFYAHFENRDDLVANAVARMFDDNRSMLNGHLGNAAPAKGLAALIDAYLSEDRLDWIDRGCPLPPLLGEASRMPPAARASFVEGVESFRTRLRTALEAMGRDDADGEANSTLSELVGAATIARAMGKGDAAADVLRSSRDRIKQRLGL